MIGKYLRYYYMSGEHPGKLRVISWCIRLLNMLKIRIIIPYKEGLFISLDLNEYVDFCIFKNGEYEPEVYKELITFAKTDEILWDIGGHIGSFSLKALKVDAVKEIRCFEPNTKTFSFLAENKKINLSKKNFYVHNFGIGEREETLPFVPNLTGNLGGSKINLGSVTEDKLLVDVNSIDNLVFAQNVPPPTLIKIDVEGFEEFVFRGAEMLFSVFPPKAVIFETNSESSKILNNKIDLFLTRRGYIIKTIKTRDELEGPFENFLAYRV